MTVIEATVEINAPIDKVWSIISDIDNEPKFWKGTKSVRNISKDDNKVTREITIAFRDQKCIQEIFIIPRDKIEAKFTQGIIDGVKITSVKMVGNKTKLDVVWDIKLTGMMGMFTRLIKKHIKGGTEQALESIKREAEM